MKVLIVGSKGHDRADCVDWMQPFPNMGEYDALVLNMVSLDQGVFDALVRTDAGKLLGLQAPILNLLANGRNVFCLATYYLVPTRQPGTGQAWTTVPPSNYDWMLLKPQLEPNKGESKSAPTEPEFARYFETLGEWNLEIVGLASPALSPYFAEAAKAVAELLMTGYQEPPSLVIRPLCVNKARKMIASKILLKRSGTGGIYLLPPPTKATVEEGIEVLLDIILGAARERRPAWWGSVEVPGLKELAKEVERRRDAIVGLNKEIERLMRQEDELSDFRGLLSEEGSALVDIVRKALSELGIETARTKPGFPVDLIDVGKVAIEVTGTSRKIDSDTDKVFQIMQFTDKNCKGEKVLLIANTHRREAPGKRNRADDFTPSVTEWLELKKVSAFTTLTLFNVWKGVKEEKLDARKARELVLGTNGVLEFTS